MIRLFLKFFFITALILLISKSLFEWILHRQIMEDRRRVVSSMHLGVLQIISNNLRETPADRQEGVLEKIRLQFRAPLELRSLVELTNAEREKIEDKDGFIYKAIDDTKEFLGVHFDSTTYLRLGPFPDVYSGGVEDSLWGLVRIMAIKVDAGVKTKEDLDRLAEELGLPMEILPNGELPDSAANRFKSGRDVAFYLDPKIAKYFAATFLSDSQRVLRIGPLPEFKELTKSATITTLGISFLLSIALISLLIYSLSRTFRRIELAAKSIALGNFGTRVDVSKAGEARELAIAFNHMASKTEDTIRTKRELLQLVSHELKTPLAKLRFATDLLETSDTPLQKKRRLDVINHSINDLELIVNEILDYVRNENSDVSKSQEWLDVQELLEPLLQRVRDENPGLNVEFVEVDPQSPVQIFVDRFAFTRTFGNLIDNAVRYAKSRVRVKAYKIEQSISAHKSKGPPTQYKRERICVEVEDDGIGIPEDKRDEVVLPFVRLESNKASLGSRNAQSNHHAGLGLGLAIVSRILQQHEGKLEIDSGEFGGCLVRTYWPNPRGFRR